MCGLIGLVAPAGQSLQNFDVSIVLQALALLRHRGPNGQKHQCLPDAENPQAILAHTRLAIVDNDPKSLQPMASDDGRYVLVFNGEIYNHAALRQALQAQGHVFQTQSDTEVLLKAFAQHGPACVEQLNGMFAMAVWNTQRQELFLARDRYGIKPLYTTQLKDGTFAVASEVKALLALPGAQRQLNEQAVAQLLTFQNIWTHDTLAQGVQSFPPGHWAVYSAKTGQLKATCYWQPVVRAHECWNPASESEKTGAAEQLKAHLQRAVALQISMGQVPVAAFLSGGLDSASLTALATASSVKPLHTFTAVFNDADTESRDEAPLARLLAQTFKTAHHEIAIGPEAMRQTFTQLAWHLDDPRAGICFQNFVLNQAVGSVATAVLSGVGGDELLAGYPWRYGSLLRQNSPGFYPACVRLLDDPQKKALFTPGFQARLGAFDSREIFQAISQTCMADDPHDAFDPLNQALCLDLKTLLPALLTVEDRCSMAHSIETRLPFLDNTVVDFCLGLPSRWKFLTEAPEGLEGKQLLRQAFRSVLPQAVLAHTKQGFTPPQATWLRQPAIWQWVQSMLCSKNAMTRDIFEPKALQNLLDEHASGQANHRQLIWTLLLIEGWQQAFLER